MGRSYAKLYRDIWADEDFCTLGPEARYIYLFLLSQADLNAAGVLPLTIRRWATRSALAAGAISAALTALSDREYVITDNGTEELLIRTFIRNDGLWRIPNTLYAVIRDAERTVSPTLRSTLAAELALLPVDELTGKRAETMRAQVTTVIATLSVTVGSTVAPRSGMRVRVRDAGAGGPQDGGTCNQSLDADARGRARGDPHLIDLIREEIYEATGSKITEDWASQVSIYLLADRDVSDAAAYLRRAIRNEPNPAKRFLPTRQPPAAAELLGENGNHTPARGDTVHGIAAQAREAIAPKDTP